MAAWSARARIETSAREATDPADAGHALNRYRVPMIELYVSHGADVNTLWHGRFPCILAPCESSVPTALRNSCSEHGADPLRSRPWVQEFGRPSLPRNSFRLGHRLVARPPVRSRDLHGRCSFSMQSPDEVRRARRGGPAPRPAGSSWRTWWTLVPALVESCASPEFGPGMSRRRRLVLQGEELLVAAEFGSPAAVALLLDRGADVNARATRRSARVGGQTAIFHAVDPVRRCGFAVTQLRSSVVQTLPFA